nr:10447_t:CDS:2 [Entrophospora candida]
MKRYSALTITRKLSSGNSDIDKFLEEIKLNSKDNDKTLKWIPYHEFSNLKEIGKGGFGIVYEAIWHDAPEQKIDLIWNKKRVALKVLFNFRFNSSNDNSLSENKQPFNLAKSNADFGQLAARRRTQSITSSTTNDNNRNNNERFKHSRSSSVKAKRLSRTFTNEEIAEEMRQLNMVPPLSGQSYGLNSINEENI